MKRILVLSRGSRLAELFFQISKNLAEDHEVIGTIHTYLSKERGTELGHIWKTTPGLVVHDMYDGIRQAYRRFLDSGKDQLETLRSVEKELGLILYRGASNYLYYRRFSKAYYKSWDGNCDEEPMLAMV